MSKRENKISRILSLVLRHDPGAIGLTLDDEGWAEVEELLACFQRHGKTLDRGLLEKIVSENDKQRFRFSQDGQKIRANQGHSVNVDLKLEEKSPPEVLYHGTAVSSMDSIEQQGLLKMARHHVHLSADARTAHLVGQRHGKPIILEIAARVMENHGFQFYLSENGVWFTEAVPPDYLNRRFTVSF